MTDAGILDGLIYGYRTVKSNGDEVVTRNKLNFGSGVVVVDNPGAETTDISIDLSELDGTLPDPIGVDGAVIIERGGVWEVRRASFDDLDPAFAISTFTGGSSVEVGDTVTNPPFAATYSSTPASANITNTDGTDSPHTLTTPFTSGTVTGAFSKSTVTSVVFTLHAIAATTKTATSSINFQARAFAGVGTAGATGATASGSTAVLVGATGTLANKGIASTVVGSSTGTLSPSGQKIYFLCVHTSTPHVFHDANGFGFPMNAPTTFSFTNQHGASLSYDLYESVNSPSTSFVLAVVS